MFSSVNYPKESQSFRQNQLLSWCGSIWVLPRTPGVPPAEPGDQLLWVGTKPTQQLNSSELQIILEEIVSEHIWVKSPLWTSSDRICPPSAEQTSNCMKYFLLQEELFIDWPYMVIRDAPGLSNIPVLSSLLHSALQNLLNLGEPKHLRVPAKNIYFNCSTQKNLELNEITRTDQRFTERVKRTDRQ